MNLATTYSVNNFDILILDKYNKIITPWYEDVHYGNIVFKIANNRTKKILKRIFTECSAPRIKM